MPPRSQNGNAFVFIFLGIVLFAALAFVVSKGLDTGATKMTTAKLRAVVGDALHHAAQVERGVARLIQRSVSESDVSFENTAVTGYDHTPVVAAAAQVFNYDEGGGVTWKEPATGLAVSDSYHWYFTSDVVVTGQGSDSRSDIIMTLPVSAEVCAEINRQLNVSIDLTSSLGNITASKFVGTFADNAAVFITPGTGIKQGCFRGLITDGAMTGSYTFFAVLLAR